jgi:two-component system response regulator RpaA
VKVKDTNLDGIKVASKGLLTTGQVARVCGVAPRTVSKWCDRGELPHFRVPLSQDRRVELIDLEAFLRRHGMATALAKLNGTLPTRATLAVGVPARHLESYATISGGELFAEETAFGGAMTLANRRASYAVLGPGLSQAEAKEMLREFRRRNLWLRYTVLLGEDWEDDADHNPWKNLGAVAVMKMPCDPDLWAARVFVAFGSPAAKEAT